MLQLFDVLQNEVNKPIRATFDRTHYFKNIGQKVDYENILALFSTKAIKMTITSGSLENEAFDPSRELADTKKPLNQITKLIPILPSSFLKGTQKITNHSIILRDSP